jgi:hypothetical protein
MNIPSYLLIRRNPHLRIAVDGSCDYDPSSTPLPLAMALVELWIANPRGRASLPQHAP